MKHLIKKILKEDISEKEIYTIIKYLDKNYNLFEINKINNVLFNFGYNKEDILVIYTNWFESKTDTKLTPLNWLNYFFDRKSLEMVETDPNPYSEEEEPEAILYKKNGLIFFEINFYSGTLGVNVEIYNFFRDNFNISLTESKSILQFWSDETFGFFPGEVFFKSRDTSSLWDMYSN